MTIATPMCDVIRYRSQWSELQTAQVVGHALVHLLRGHVPLATPVVCKPVYAIETEHRPSCSGFIACDAAQEYEAEYSASYLLTRLNLVRNWCQHQIAEDYRALSALRQFLQSSVPNAYVAPESVCSASSKQPDRFDLVRLVVEITDARLAALREHCSPGAMRRGFSRLST